MEATREVWAGSHRLLPTRGAQKHERASRTPLPSARLRGSFARTPVCHNTVSLQNRNINVLILDSSSTFVKQWRVERRGTGG